MIFALILTIAVEAIVMWLLTKSKEWCKYNVYCNMVTNPLLNIFVFLFVRISAFIRTGGIFLFYFSNNDLYDYYLPMVIGEIFVVIAEMKIYELLTKEKRSLCFKYSLITNLVTAILGVIINVVF